MSLEPNLVRKNKTKQHFHLLVENESIKMKSEIIFLIIVAEMCVSGPEVGV